MACWHSLREFQQKLGMSNRRTSSRLRFCLLAIHDLTIFCNRLIFLITFSTEGVPAGRFRKREKGWRPRARLVTPHSGGPGTRPGGTMTPPRGARCVGPRKCGFKKRGPGEQKSPRWSAERRPRSSQEGRGKTEEGSAAWRSIPSQAEGNESKPRRARGILSPATGHPPPRTTPRRETENA